MGENRADGRDLWFCEVGWKLGKYGDPGEIE